MALQHVDDFLATCLADDEIVRTHPQSVFEDNRAEILPAFAFDVGRAVSMRPRGSVAVKFGGVFGWVRMRSSTVRNERGQCVSGGWFCRDPSYTDTH